MAISTKDARHLDQYLQGCTIFTLYLYQSIFYAYIIAEKYQIQNHS